MGIIEVPQGMCEAVGAACPANSEGQAVRDLTVIRAALRWQKVNPPVPTLPQLRAVEMAAAHEPSGSTGWLSDVLQEWVRRMYDEPEPEVPEEIKDLLEPHANSVPDPSRPEREFYRRVSISHNEHIIEAFRRGQKAGPK